MVKFPDVVPDVVPDIALFDQEIAASCKKELVEAA